MNLTIAFRCDAAHSIGSGHVMRCRNLAYYLKAHGACVYFICREFPDGNLISLLQRDFDVISLPSSSLRTSDYHSKLCSEKEFPTLGCSPEVDAFESSTYFREVCQCDLHWIIVDHYGIESTWEQCFLDSIKSSQQIDVQLMVIDDLANRSHVANLLLDQNYYQDNLLRYHDLVPSTCSLYLGPKYALLRPEYALMHNIVPQRTCISRILVFFGGADPYGLTYRSLVALQNLHAPHISIDVVVGRQNKDQKRILLLSQSMPAVTIHMSMPSLAGLIARADLAIGAGGSTVWERICLGLPSLLISFGEDQHASCQSLAQSGFIHWLGPESDVSADQISAYLKQVFELKITIPSTKALVDGNGVQRISAILLGEA